MQIRTLLTLVFTMLVCSVGFAHQDAIIRWRAGKLETLPEKYQPASFSLHDPRLVIGELSVVIPECVWERFGEVKEQDLSFVASWYHDPKNLPPYLGITIGRSGEKVSHELLVDLGTLSVIWLRKIARHSDGETYEKISLEPSCAAAWKVVRKP